MKKRILSLVLALSMMISLFPVSALAQTTGGGTAVLAEENGTTATPIITIGSDGKPTTEGGENWTYEDLMLTLNSGTYDFSGETVTCYVKVCSGATVAGGIFENTVWNEAGGKISGGTFADVSNRGTIIGGTFTGAHGSIINHTTIAGGVFEKNVTNGDSGDEGISASITGGLFKAEVQNKAASAAITGGVFVTKPTGSGTIANVYTLTTSGRTSKFLYAADGKEIDLGQSVYVVPNTNENDVLKVAGTGITEWDVVVGDDTYELTSWTGAQMQSGSKDTFVLKQDVVTTQDATVTLKKHKAYNTALEIGADGKPMTENRKPYGNGGVQGDGWTYDGTTLKLNPTSAKEFTLNSAGTTIEGAYLNCDLEIGENATAKGTIALTRKVINNGTIDKVRFGGDGEGHYPNLTNNGTVKNCSIALASVTNNGAMENVSFVTCSKLENSVGATIENAVVRKDSKSILYRNYGTMKKAVFDFSPSGEQKVRILKASRGENVAARLDGCEYAVFGTQLYVVGEPTLKIKINDADNTTITDVNSNVNYGGLKSNKDSNGYQQFTVQSGNGDIVLNQIGAPAPGEVKHTLTLNDAVIVKDDGSTATTGEYKEGTTVKIKPKIENQWKVFNGVWYTNPYAFSAIESNGDDTYTLTMPGYNLTVEACSVNRSYQLTVNGGTIEGAYSNIFAWGSQVRVTANAPKTGEHFAGWEAKKTGTDTTIALYGWSGNTIDLTKENLIFQMPTSNVTLTATYAKNPTYPLTITGGKITNNEATSGSFEQGKVITIVADAPANGFAFVGWNALNGTTCPVFSSADKDTRTYKFEMPAEKVELEAVYEPTGSGELVLVNGVPDINNAIRRNVHENVTTYFGRGWEYRVSDETDPSKNLLFLTGENFVLDKNSSSDSLKCNLEIGEYTSVKGTISLTQAVKIEGTVDGMYFDGAEVTVDTSGTVTNSILHNVTVKNNGNIKNCVSDTKLPGAQELTEANGATITATFDGCAGEVSGETLYFTGTPTLKVKVKGGTVEKANGEDVGQADENGWHTVTAAEDGNIKLTKSTPTPNPDAQPTTYTITTDIYGEVNGGASATVKENDWVHMTVAEVPEGMTFDYWNIPDALLKALQKQNSGFRNNVESLSFQMPDMGEEEQTFAIKANFRSSELPGEDAGPSTLGTMATVAVGGAAAGILVWQGVSLGVDSYL